MVVAGHAGEHEDSAQATFDARDNIGIHAVADHHGFFGVGAEGVQGGAHHEGIWFAHEIGGNAGDGTDHGGHRASAGDDAAHAGSAHVGICGDEASASIDEAYGLGDALEAMGCCFAEHDVIGCLIGQGVTDVVERDGQAGFADDKGAPIGLLLMEELGRGERGCENGLSGYVQSHVGEAHLQVALRVERIVSENEEGNILCAQALYKFACARDHCIALDNDAIHIGQVVFDAVHMFYPFAVFDFFL